MTRNAEVKEVKEAQEVKETRSMHGWVSLSQAEKRRKKKSRGEEKSQEKRKDNAEAPRAPGAQRNWEREKRQTTLRRRSRRPRRKSATRARSAAGIAPARMTASLTMATPRKMNVPSPPAPIAAPMVMTVAVRMPARITPSARGSRTRKRICELVMPIASAASRTAGSMPLSPT